MGETQRVGAPDREKHKSGGNGEWTLDRGNREKGKKGKMKSEKSREKWGK